MSYKYVGNSDKQVLDFSNTDYGVIGIGSECNIKKLILSPNTNRVDIYSKPIPVIETEYDNKITIIAYDKELSILNIISAIGINFMAEHVTKIRCMNKETSTYIYYDTQDLLRMLRKKKLSKI